MTMKGALESTDVRRGLVCVSGRAASSWPTEETSLMIWVTSSLSIAGAMFEIFAKSLGGCLM